MLQIAQEALISAPTDKLRGFCEDLGAVLELSPQDRQTLLEDALRTAANVPETAFCLEQATWLAYHHRRQRGPSLRQIENAFLSLGADPDTGRCVQECPHFHAFQTLLVVPGIVRIGGLPCPCINSFFVTSLRQIHVPTGL